MKKAIVIILFVMYNGLCFSQTDTSKWVRAFPITDYLVELNDSIKLVQVHLPDGLVIKEKQIGVLKGVYNTVHSDTSIIGAGRCQLIKGDYYYFSINHKASGRIPKENDLLYVIVDKPIVHFERLVKIAANHTEIQNVYEEPLFDRYKIFTQWTADDERACIDSMRNDIHFTGDYFLKNDPSMNVKIPGGKYKGQMVLNVMIKCTAEDVKDFLDYIIVRPTLYAGRKWKISEIFATWLSEGAPTVLKE
jgi:hypothetical protein